MNQGDRCLVIHGGVEMEGVIKSHHRELDQVLVAVHKECGGYFEILRSPQDLRLISESPSSAMKWKDNLETAEERPTPETSNVTPMDLDSEERDTAVFLANLSTSGSNAINPTPSRSWTDKDGDPISSHRSMSRSAPASGFVMGRFPVEEVTGVHVASKSLLKEKYQVPGQFNSHSPSQSPSVHTHLQELRAESGDDVDSIARIMEISLNASSPTGAQNYRPIVYLATSPHFEESDAPGVLLATRASSSLTAHTVSRPINIPVRRQGREIPISGLSSPKHAHVAHLVLSDSTMAASLSSSTSSTSAFGSVPTQLGSLSPPSSLPPGATSVPIPGSGRRVRSDVKKCRKIYGIEHRDQWCNQCRWKKACTRFPDPTSPPRHG